jgi:hypothetical protein
MKRREWRERTRLEAKVAEQIAKAATDSSSKRRFDDFLGLAGFALGLASWGWSVLAPSSSASFGSILLFFALVAMAFAIRRIWSLKAPAFVGVLIVALLGFATFDWYIVIKPQRGKPFQALLVEGYHLTTECGGIPARQQMPPWMRDELKSWQTRSEQLIDTKLPTRDSQLWHGAIVIGLISDENTVAYQCTALAIKVAALETIVSTEYDPTLKHQPYNGPTYWFEPTNGKIDISEALTASGGKANIAIEDLGGDKKQSPQDRSVPKSQNKAP